MKIFHLLSAVVLYSAVSLQASAADLPFEAKVMLEDLGAPAVQQQNNDKLLQCLYGGTKKITVSQLEGATVFSGEYINCKEGGPARDGYFEVIVKDGEIVGRSEKRSVNGELFDAAQAGDSNKVKELIRKKADVNYTETVPTTDEGTIEGWTPLMSAAAAGDISIVRQLINAGAWVNYMNSKAFNALWLAATNGHLDIVKLLVANGAYINNQNIDEVE